MGGAAWQQEVRPILLAATLIGAAGQATADEPLSVVYGPAAKTTEGDHDHREVIYLSVPDNVTERLYLRVYDADTGGAHDTRYGSGWDTEIRYVLHGGAGAAGPRSAPAAGTVLSDTTVAQQAAADDAWQTLASFRPDSGDHVDGRYVFRLEVTGLAGDDGNLFGVTLSRRERRDATPAGLAVAAPAPTVRIPDRQRATELAFDIPPDAERLRIGNFDAAGGRIAFASTYRTVELEPSGQDRWRESAVELLPEERGGPGSLLLAHGQEMPNDLTVAVTDGHGQSLPLHLPARAAVANQRPRPVVEQAPLADCAASGTAVQEADAINRT